MPSPLPALPLPLPLPFLLGATLHLAKGFGGGDSTPRRPAKAARGKLVPCTACRGSGKKPCQFCQGTTLMKGFLGQKVPCVPCQGKATLGRPCKECSGVGYFTP